MLLLYVITTILLIISITILNIKYHFKKMVVDIICSQTYLIGTKKHKICDLLPISKSLKALGSMRG